MYSQWVEPSDDDLRAAVASMVVGAEDNAASVRILSSSSEPGSAVGDGLTSVLRAISVQFQARLKPVSITVEPPCMVHGCKVNPLVWSIYGWSQS